MATNSKKITATYILGLMFCFGALYGLFSYGSHRYCMIHEGFKSQLDDSRKLNGGKKTELSDNDIKDKTKQVQTLLDEVYKELNFDKNIDDYEDLVDDLHDLVDANILNNIMKNKDGLSANLTDAKSMTNIKDMNELGKFQDILKNMTTFLNKN